jgi:hypothetical protein
MNNRHKHVNNGKNKKRLFLQIFIIIPKSSKLKQCKRDLRGAHARLIVGDTTMFFFKQLLAM